MLKRRDNSYCGHSYTAPKNRPLRGVYPSLSLFLGAVFILMPTLACAQVVINEIAWMGTNSGSADEWIELRNIGTSDVSLEGWALEATDGSPSMVLEGTIAVGGYFLLERTDDSTVPGVTADMIYTGALGNSGETLTLKDADGVIVDTASGGENWENIGGDNETKQTAQRAGSNWITADPTPRAANASTGAQAEDHNEEDDSSSATTHTDSSTENDNEEDEGDEEMPLTNRDAALQLKITTANSILVNTSTPFEVEMYRGDTAVSAASFTWNFGDGVVEKGKQLHHTYRFPGEYTVVVEGVVGDEQLIKEFTVTSIAPEIAVTAADSTRISLRNNSAVDVDLGGWALQAGESSFTMPAPTIVKAGKTLALASTVTKLFPQSVNEVGLLYPNGLTAHPPIESSQTANTPDRIHMAREVSESGVNSQVEVAADTQTADMARAERGPAPSNGQLASVQSTLSQKAPEEKHASLMAWLLGLLAVMGMGVAGVLMIRREKISSAVDDFEITEEENDDIAKS